MSENGGIHPFWRAVVGASFGLAVGVVWATKGFWLALLVLLLIIAGGLAGVLFISGD